MHGFSMVHYLHRQSYEDGVHHAVIQNKRCMPCIDGGPPGIKKGMVWERAPRMRVQDAQDEHPMHKIIVSQGLHIILAGLKHGTSMHPAQSRHEFN